MKKCVGIVCHLGRVTGVGCSGNDPCPLEKLAAEHVIQLGVEVAQPLLQFLKFDEAQLRISDISYWRWDLGHSYTKLIVTMRDGREFAHTDRRGSAHELERHLKLAVGAE